MSEANLIPTNDLIDEFDEFLKIGSNGRIFFSGKFGIGKTFFLKNFFQSRLAEYETFHLFPINYQISNNEDVIELLKYDILTELIKRNENIIHGNEVKGIGASTLLFYSWCKSKYSTNSALQSALSAGELASDLFPDPIIATLGKLGKPLRELLSLDKDFQVFKKEYLAGDRGLAQSYMDAIRSKDIRESDYLSHLIDEKIKELKQSKKSVLVLDDIDRIDPEHLFRILNIFSAHFGDDSNKFGFDRVVIVGDVRNIKSIFHHKYGEGADFDGYFDKFFSVKPYFLDNRQIVAEKIPYLVKQIRYDEPTLASAIGESGYIKLLLSEILTKALILEKLNLRQLYKPINHPFLELKRGVYAKDSFRDGFLQVFDVGIKLLVAIFGGDKDTLALVLREIRKGLDGSEAGNGIPYGRYSLPLAKTLIKLGPGKVAWKEYYLTLPVDPDVRQLEVDGGDLNQARVFYELLAEYVSREKFVKKSHFDYSV